MGVAETGQRKGGTAVPPTRCQSPIPSPLQPPKPPSISSDSSDGKPLALKAESLRRSGGGGAEVESGPPAVSSPQKRGGKKSTPAKAAAAAANGGASTSAAAATTKPGAAVTQQGAAPTAAASAGELPLILPDRLPPAKLIVELEDGGDGGRTDLTGDAGVVGRVLVDASADGGGAVRLDLKGTLYAATLVPCVGTLAVVNVTGDAARVEAVARSFAVLTPEAGGGDDDRGDLFAGADDDDDGYEPVAVTQAADVGGGGGGGGGKGAKRARTRAAPGKARGRGRGKKAKR